MNDMSYTQPSKRISVVDSLRGFALVGIIVIHFLEHLNFYAFPEPSAFEQGLWDVVFFLGSNKMYAIFSLLFGLSCFIQHDNQAKRGGDFRPRFAWRMLLLFLFGEVDLVFFNGDILCTYAAMGMLLIPLIRAKNAVLWTVAAVLFFQPVEIGYLIAALFNPSVMPMDLGLGPLWGKLYEACAEGGFFDVARTNLECGLQINFGWAIEHGRLTQTLLLFVMGMLLGRKRLFLNEGQNLRIWVRVMVVSVMAFAVAQPLAAYVPGKVDSVTISQSLSILFTSWRNLAMTAFYVSGLTLLYYKTPLCSLIGKFRYIGKMSLTGYLLQSIAGAFLFYHWGLGLFTVASHGYSFLLSVGFIIVLYYFCKWWTSHHRRGPFEQVWFRLTWLGTDRK